MSEKAAKRAFSVDLNKNNGEKNNAIYGYPQWQI